MLCESRIMLTITKQLLRELEVKEMKNITTEEQIKYKNGLEKKH